MTVVIERWFAVQCTCCDVLLLRSYGRQSGPLLLAPAEETDCDGGDNGDTCQDKQANLPGVQRAAVLIVVAPTATTGAIAIALVDHAVLSRQTHAWKINI